MSCIYAIVQEYPKNISLLPHYSFETRIKIPLIIRTIYDIFKKIFAENCNNNNNNKKTISNHLTYHLTHKAFILKAKRNVPNKLYTSSTELRLPLRHFQAVSAETNDIFFIAD